MKKTTIRLLQAGAVALGMGTGGGLAQEGPPPTRAQLTEWVTTQRLISKEQQDWRAAEAVLRDRIDLVQRETDAIREQTAEARNDIGEADRKLAELETENEELKSATGGLKDRITALERRVLALLQSSPTPIRERVKLLSQRIPKNPIETKVGLSERFQNVVGILNEMNKYALDISEAVEVRELADGTTAEVTVLYLGLGQAYYCNESGGVAGVGRPGPSGWSWESHNDKVRAIADLIAVFRNEKAAAYVPVPAAVRDVPQPSGSVNDQKASAETNHES